MSFGTIIFILLYNGGKNGSGVYQTIINWIPPHEVFIEPFLGSGAIINQIKASKRSIGIEINPAVIDKFDYAGHIELINACGLGYLKELTFARAYKDIFIYADPPYPKVSRRSQKNIYKYEFTDEQHIELLDTLKKLPYKIALSSYPNELYDTQLSDWHKIDFNSQTRVGTAIERLYMNYKAPKKLHDYSFLGSDFTDRQRIKRKIKGKIVQLLCLPHLERAAIMEALRSSID